MILLKNSAQFVICVYLTLQLFYREFLSCGGLQTSRKSGRREYEIAGKTPTCYYLVGRLSKTQTVGWIFSFLGNHTVFILSSKCILKSYNIVVEKYNVKPYNRDGVTIYLSSITKRRSYVE